MSFGFILHKALTALKYGSETNLLIIFLTTYYNPDKEI